MKLQTLQHPIKKGPLAIHQLISGVLHLIPLWDLASLKFDFKNCLLRHQ